MVFVIESREDPGAHESTARAEIPTSEIPAWPTVSALTVNGHTSSLPFCSGCPGTAGHLGTIRPALTQWRSEKRFCRSSASNLMHTIEIMLRYHRHNHYILIKILGFVAEQWHWNLLTECH